MADELSQILGRMSARCDAIEMRSAALIEDKRNLSALNEELQERIGVLRRELENASLENEYLRVSHKVAPRVEDVKEAKAMIAGLIRQIDKCIAQLKE